MTRVSVIIPTFNGARYVTQAVDSALAQTHDCCEVVVVDDGSTDDTEKLLDPYRDRVQCVYQDHAGPGRARNHGLAVARGEFVVFLDSDDLLFPSALADHLACFAMDPNLELVSSGWQLLDHSGCARQEVQPWLEAPELNLEGLLRCHAFYLPALMFRREVLERAGGFDPGLRQAQDVDLLLRVMLGGCKAAWLMKTTVLYRQHPGNRTRRARERVDHVNRVFAAFFSRPDLPPRISALERQVRYQVLMWGAWQLYRAGDTGQITHQLQQSRAFLGGTKSQVLHAWLEQIKRLGREEGRGEEIQALGEFLPWCRAALSLEASAQPGDNNG